jgi:predicted nucleic acid-binding protein
MSLLLNAIEIVPIPSEIIDSEESIRDINDRPILRAAISANADIFLTGDKDFLESGIKHPKILTASEFLEY